MRSRLGFLAITLKLCALQTKERTRSRCCWFINAKRKLLMVSALFVLANYKGAKSSGLTTMIILRNSSASLSQHWNRVDVLWASANSASSFLAHSLMCHSFRSPRSVQPHTVLHTLLLSLDSAHTGPHHGHRGKYMTNTVWKDRPVVWDTPPFTR